MYTNGEDARNLVDLPVAIDTMGGDRGPSVVVEGAVKAFKELGVRSVLVGPEDELSPLLAPHDVRSGVSIQHAEEVIGMGESPTRAVRKKPNSSLVKSFRLVEVGEASAVLSTGNSGAMMAAGVLVSGMLTGIERPAIATLLPVAGDDAPNVILDAGANVDCHAQHFVQFAIMGSAYCASLFNIEKPRVALLSNGSEPSKGTDVTRSSSNELQRLPGINYVGYVEGRDVGTKKADVIVCDGFVGNIVLKTMEGCVRLVSDQILHEAKKGVVRRLGVVLLRGLLKDTFRERFDYTAYGGAPLLGLRHLALVLHGSSDSRAVYNAVRVAKTFAERGMIAQIAQGLSQLESDSSDNVDGLFVGTGFEQDEAKKKSRIPFKKRQPLEGE